MKDSTYLSETSSLESKTEDNTIHNAAVVQEVIHSKEITKNISSDEIFKRPLDPVPNNLSPISNESTTASAAVGRESTPIDDDDDDSPSNAAKTILANLDEILSSEEDKLPHKSKILFFPF